MPDLEALRHLLHRRSQLIRTTDTAGKSANGSAANGSRECAPDDRLRALLRLMSGLTTLCCLRRAHGANPRPANLSSRFCG
jgi:hypothetical protein